MDIVFWGQMKEAEFASSFSTVWRRECGSVLNIPFKRMGRNAASHDEAFQEAYKILEQAKPKKLILWQGHFLDGLKSRRLRKLCDKMKTEFIYVSIDDPFVLHNVPQRQGFLHAHKAVTCDLGSMKHYASKGVKPIFAPPACSWEHHILKAELTPKRKKGIFFYFINPYVGEPYSKYGAFSRWEMMKVALGISAVGFATRRDPEEVREQFTDEEWAKIEFLKHVKYEDFHTITDWELYFNSSVVGREHCYFNQRVFEILGIGGVQLIEMGKPLQDFFSFMLEEAKVERRVSPFLGYDSKRSFELELKEALSKSGRLEERRAAARKLRKLWTFDHLVRRIAYGEKTIFDRFAQKHGYV